MPTTVEVVSLGAGVQSTALAISDGTRPGSSLNATGQVQPRATCAVFADTGGELPETYAHLDRLTLWLERRSFPVVRVARPQSLEAYTLARSCPIPIRQLPGGAAGFRQCTAKWKIAEVNRQLRPLGATAGVVQLGISTDELHRARDNHLRWVRNRHPSAKRRASHDLLELGLSRDACRDTITAAGLPEPPKSACWFCPLRPRAHWRQLAQAHPDLFERACHLEEVINARRATRGQLPAFLAGNLRLLRQSVRLATAAAIVEDDEAGACGGHCFM